MHVTRVAGALLVVGACAALAGCGGRGAVTFRIEAPAREDLSPFADDRRQSAALFDELTSEGLGSAINLRAGPGATLSMGDLPVGRYDVRMLVSGGSQLIGLARTPAVEVPLGESVEVSLHARKPIGLWGTYFIAGDDGNIPQPGLLMAIDTTLPPPPATIELHNLVPTLDPNSLVSASAGSRDGQYLLFAGGGRFAQVRTTDMLTVALSSLLNARGLANVTLRAHRIVVSSDDRWFAVLSDQGIHLGSLDAIRDRTLPRDLSILPLADVIDAEFAPDGRTLTVLTGPSWQSLDCPVPSTPSRIYDLPVEGVTMLGAPREAPAGTTDLAWHPRLGLLLANGCGQAVIAESDPARAVLSGNRIQEIAVAGERVFGVEEDIKWLQVEYDPFDESQRNVRLPFGQLRIGTGATSSRITYPIVTYRPSFAVAGEIGSRRTKSLEPVQVNVYGMSLTPDASHVVILERIRYTVPEHDNLLHEVASATSRRVYRLEVDRDRYSVRQIDLNRGTVSYGYATGIAEPTPCRIRAYDCNQFGTGCVPAPARDESCAYQDGYAPGGLSVLLGHN